MINIMVLSAWSLVDDFEYEYHYESLMLVINRRPGILRGSILIIIITKL